MIDGVSYVFVYEDELKEMMERVDAGKDPKGPNTMGLSDGSSSTIGDLNNNTSDDYANGTATSSVSSDDSDDSSDSSDSDYYEEPTGDGNGYEATTKLRRFTKRRNGSTLRAAQGDNLSFKRQDMTRRSMPCLFHANLFALDVAR